MPEDRKFDCAEAIAVWLELHEGNERFEEILKQFGEAFRLYEHKPSLKDMMEKNDE